MKNKCLISVLIIVAVFFVAYGEDASAFYKQVTYGNTSGGSTSITAGSDFIVVSPSPITGTGTTDAGNKIKVTTASLMMNNYGGI